MIKQLNDFFYNGNMGKGIGKVIFADKKILLYKEDGSYFGKVFSYLSPVVYASIVGREEISDIEMVFASDIDMDISKELWLFIYIELLLSYLLANNVKTINFNNKENLFNNDQLNITINDILHSLLTSYYTVNSEVGITELKYVTDIDQTFTADEYFNHITALNDKYSNKSVLDKVKALFKK